MTLEEKKKFEKIKSVLGVSDEEAKQIMEDDKKVDHNEPLEWDLTDEQKKVAKQYTKTGTRKTTAYNFSKRERKENITKSGLISILHKFLTETDEILVENAEITNKERQIAFKVGEDSFELTLVQKRKPKK